MQIPHSNQGATNLLVKTQEGPKQRDLIFLYILVMNESLGSTSNMWAFCLFLIK